MAQILAQDVLCLGLIDLDRALTIASDYYLGYSVRGECLPSGRRVQHVTMSELSANDFTIFPRDMSNKFALLLAATNTNPALFPGKQIFWIVAPSFAAIAVL